MLTGLFTIQVTLGASGVGWVRGPGGILLQPTSPRRFLLAALESSTPSPSRVLLGMIFDMVTAIVIDKIRT